ncbi:MAG: helix-hairpin-helix domain-containing protein [Candidatus Nitrosocaldus sp.]
METASVKPDQLSENEIKSILDFLNNTRDASDIAAKIEIPGERDVGIKIAQAIVAHRAKIGGFKSLDDVMNVPGIGEKRFTDIAVSVLAREVEPERMYFKQLLLQNPNYFGNIKDSILQPVKPLQLNTKYEELMCIGYNPPSKRLEAVVHIKQSFGYGGGVCSAGTQEYVRFFIDWNNDGSWKDVGMVSFTVYNILGKKPLEYAATLTIDADDVFCKVEKLPRVRAILSWNVMPPANDPNWIPVWGNVKEVQVQIDTFKWIIFKDLVKLLKVQMPVELAEIDIDQKIMLKEPKELSVIQLKELYKDKGKEVPEHRFAFKDVYKMLSTQVNPIEAANIAAQYGINLSDIVNNILQILYNTTYEEITCVGLDTNEDALVSVVRIKMPYGYSGNLCTKGSMEYISFWIDWLDGSGWTYAGTTAVNVHDISSIPKDGLYYSVYLPVDLSTRRQPCGQGPKMARVRAILSWNVMPPANDPNWNPVWGNRMDTHVHIPPGITVKEGECIPYIINVGSMNVCNIDQNTGLANGPSTGTANFTAVDSPFGGIVTISGYITNPPHYLSGGNAGAKLKYKVSVRQLNPIVTQWQAVTDPFWIQVTEQIGSTPVTYNMLQMPDSNGYFEYIQDNPPGPWRDVFADVLARWNTSGLSNGLWEIKIDVLNPVTNQTWTTGTLICSNGESRSTVKVRLDNTRPEAELTIDMIANSDYISNPAATPTSPMAICGKMKSGVYIIGRFKAKDTGTFAEHFYSYSFEVLPSSIGGNPTPQNFKHVPAADLYPAIPTTGIQLPSPPPYPLPLPDGIWQLNTNGMLPCGYVVRLTVSDRTIVNSSSIGWKDVKEVGFCLE